MPNPCWIKSTTLQTLLRVSRSALSLWHSTKFLSGVVINRERHFHSTEIDKVLMAGSFNFQTPPCADDLLSGRLSLLTSQEAVALLGLQSVWGLHDRVKSGKIQAIRLGRAWRFSTQSVDACKQAELGEDQFQRTVVYHVLGVTQKRLEMLVKDGRLKVVPSSVHSLRRPITRDSLLELLSDLLPEWIDPRDWLDDRLEDERPLVSFPQAQLQLGVNKETLWALLRGQHLPYINAPHAKEVFIAPDGIAAQLEHNGPISREDIGKLFGVNIGAVGYWLREGLLICPIEAHDHSNDQSVLYPACLVAIIRPMLSPGMKALYWYRCRLNGDGELVSDTKAAAFLDVSLDTIRHRAESGQMFGIKTPKGTWMFTHQQLAVARRRQQG